MTENSLIRSYGRIKSRKLSNSKNHLLDHLYKKYELSKNFIVAIDQPQISQESPDHSSLNQKNYSSAQYKKTFLEIGFGFGDFLFTKAKTNTDTMFIGFEPHINGVVNLLSKLANDTLDNLKISTYDVRMFLQALVNKGTDSDQSSGLANQDQNLCFDGIFILFPDPWPKSRHFKRRLINRDFLDNLLAPTLKKGGVLTIATDHDSYKTWIISEMLHSEHFTWNASSKKDWQEFPDDWIITKYQRKAKQEGRNSIIINLIRN